MSENLQGLAIVASSLKSLPSCAHSTPDVVPAPSVPTSPKSCAQSEAEGGLAGLDKETMPPPAPYQEPGMGMFQTICSIRKCEKVIMKQPTKCWAKCSSSYCFELYCFWFCVNGNGSQLFMLHVHVWIALASTGEVDSTLWRALLWQGRHVCASQQVQTKGSTWTVDYYGENQSRGISRTSRTLLWYVSLFNPRKFLV